MRVPWTFQWRKSNFQVRTAKVTEMRFFVFAFFLVCTQHREHFTLVLWVLLKVVEVVYVSVYFWFTFTLRLVALCCPKSVWLLQFSWQLRSLTVFCAVDTLKSVEAYTLCFENIFLVYCKKYKKYFIRSNKVFENKEKNFSYPSSWIFCP